MPLQCTSGRSVSSSRLDVVLLEDDHVVDRAQRGHEQRAVLRRHHGPALALQAAHRGVAVDAHHEHVGLRPGALQVADVAHVEHVEAAVGEGDRPPLAPRRGHALAHLLERGRPWPARLPHWPARPASPRTAATSSSAETVAVARFITTMPPA